MRSSWKRPSPVVSSSSETAGAVSRDTSARARPSSVTTRAAWRCWPITGTTRAGAIHHAVATSWAEANESAASANEPAAVTSSPARSVARPARAASTPEPASERISTSPTPKPTRTTRATPATAAPATTNGRRADERAGGQGGDHRGQGGEEGDERRHPERQRGRQAQQGLGGEHADERAHRLAPAAVELGCHRHHQADRPAHRPRRRRAGEEGRAGDDRPGPAAGVGAGHADPEGVEGEVDVVGRGDAGGRRVGEHGHRGAGRADQDGEGEATPARPLARRARHGDGAQRWKMRDRRGSSVSSGTGSSAVGSP